MGKKIKPISLALQGGGAHGALTWGVLDRLLDEPLLDIRAITATSAGAMNAAAYANGLAVGGRPGAKAVLHDFWRDMSRRAAPALAMTRLPEVPGLGAINEMMPWTPFDFFSAVASVASPYDLNPFDFNPLRDTLRASIDYEAVRAADLELHLTATNVETGRARVFSGDEVTLDATLASACLPQTFKAVEIDGVPYWDGGYMGNPSLFPLIYSKAPGDILLVMLNPLRREGLPKSAPAITDRLTEISFNAALFGELRAIGFVQKLLDENWLADRAQRRYRRLYMHVINGGDAVCELSLESKFDTSWSFLTKLRDQGRTLADKWLEDNFESLGKASTVDIRDEFLDV